MPVTINAVLGTGDITLRQVSKVHGPRPTPAIPVQTLYLGDYRRGGRVANGPSENAGVPTSGDLTMNQLKGTVSPLTFTEQTLYWPASAYVDVFLFQPGLVGTPAFDWRVTVPSSSGRIVIYSANRNGENIPLNTPSRWFSVEVDGGCQVSVYGKNGGGPDGVIVTDAYLPLEWGEIVMEFRISDTTSPVGTLISEITGF